MTVIKCKCGKPHNHFCNRVTGVKPNRRIVYYCSVLCRDGVSFSGMKASEGSEAPNHISWGR